MARGPSARVVLNRKALAGLTLALADGMEELARTIVETADPPDAPPYGQGLAARGGWLVYANGKKVAGGGLDGKQPKKPRAWRASRDGVSAVAGFGFPARFQEFGTVNHAAQPFLTPAVGRVRPYVEDIMGPVVRKALRGIGIA